MTNKRFFTAIFAAPVIAAVFFAPAQCREASVVRSLELVPFVRTVMRYDDNIYLSENSPVFSWINDTSAGLTARAAFTKQFALSGGYTLQSLDYAHTTRRNAGQYDAIHHNLWAEGSFRPVKGTTLSAADRFLATTDPENSEITFRTKRIANAASLFAEAIYRDGPGVSLEAHNDYIRYLSSDYETLDRTETYGRLNFSYGNRERGQLYAFGGIGAESYVNSANNDGYYVDSGLGWRKISGGVLTANIAAGGEMRRYTGSKTVAGYKSCERTITPALLVDLKWNPTETLTIDIKGSKKTVPYPSFASRHYDSNMADLTLRQTVWRMEFSAGGAFEYARFSDRDPGEAGFRVDRNYQGRAGIACNIQSWLKAGVAYAYRGRYSTISGQGYQNHTYSLELKAAL